MLKEFVRDCGPVIVLIAFAACAVTAIHTVSDEETAKRNANATWTLEDKTGPIAFGLSWKTCNDIMADRLANNAGSIGCRKDSQ